MSNSIHLISLLLLASGLSIQAQEKRAMTFDEMVGWERISEQRISDNGKWVIIGKTKSTNFQNEKYKKGMSFKYYINGA